MKKVVRLTEEDVKKIINKTTKKVLNEDFFGIGNRLKGGLEGFKQGKHQLDWANKEAKLGRAHTYGAMEFSNDDRYKNGMSTEEYVDLSLGLVYNNVSHASDILRQIAKQKDVTDLIQRLDNMATELMRMRYYQK